MATNYLSRRSSAAVNLNLSTLTGSAITTSTITVSTLNLQSTTISLGQSTNQTYNNFSNGSYAPPWTTAKSAMTSVNKTVQSANGLYQMLVANATSGLFLSSDSGITWSTLSGGLPTLTGSAYWSDGAISANGQYITLSIYGGSLWMSADYGRTFALTNQPTPNIWLPLNGNTTDSMGLSVVTTPGTVPGYVTLNYPGYTAQAVNLFNTAGSTATRYIRGTWTGATNFTVSFWFNVQSFGGTQQALFVAYAGNYVIALNASNQITWYIPSGGSGLIAVTGPVVVINTWYYVTAIFQTNGTCSLYVNNSLAGSYTNLGGVGSYTTTAFAIGTYDTSTPSAFNGYVDDLRIYNSVSTYVPIPLLQPNIWLPFENTAGDLGSHSLAPGATPTIYLPFEGNLTDSMGASTVTATGAVTYPTGYIGQALRLTNPTGGTAEQFVRGTWTSPSIYTVSGWFNLQTSTATGNQFVFSTGGTSGPNAVILYINTNTQLAAQVPNGVTIVAPVTISLNTWYSFTLKVYPSGRQCSLYFNNSIYSAAATATATPSGTFGIGTFDVGGTSSAFNGLIDDFRITNFDVPLSIVSVTGSLSYVSGVVGLNAVNIANTASGTATNYIRGAWNYFNNFTVSGWVNIQSLASSFQVIYSSHNAIIEIFLNSSNQLVAQLPTGSGASYNNIITTFPISINTWYHLVMIFQINGLCSFLVNGSVIGTFTNSGGYGTVTSSGVFCLGTYDAGTSYAFNGYVDDFRIYNAVIPIHVLFPQNYRSLALSGTGQYALAAAASGWVVGSSNSSQTWSRQAVSVGTQVSATHALSINYTGQYQLVATGPAAGSIIPNQTGLAAATWTQGGVNWTASANTAVYPSHRAFNNLNASAADKWETTSSSYTGGSFSYAGAASTTIQTIGPVGGDWLQIQSSVPLVLTSYSIGANDLIGRSPKTYYIVGSNDGSTWFPIQFCNFATIPFTSTFTTTSYITVNLSGTQSITAGQTASLTTTIYTFTTNAYMYFRMVTTHLFSEALINIGEWNMNFRNSVSYSNNYGSTWLNTSQTVSNESVALSPSGQYALSTNSVAPFARLTFDNTNVDSQGSLTPATGLGTPGYSTSTKTVGTHSAQFANATVGGTPTVYLNYTLPAVLNKPSMLTMSFWMYPTGYASTGYVITLTNGTQLGPYFYFRSGIVGLTFNINGGGNQYAEYAQVPPLNAWTHLAMTFTGSLLSFYMNGVLLGTMSASGNLTLTNGGNITNLFVGTLSASSGAFAGNVDDVRIYTSALSADEVNGLFRNPALTQTISVSNSYLPITSYTEPVLPGITANVVDTAVSQTGQYMVAVTSSTTNNVYYSTDFGATFTALTIGTTAMVSCSISYDGSYLTATNATTTFTLNRNTRGFSLAVGNQAGRINQGLNAIAIGDKAGQTNQSANSIVLNATGTALDAVAPGFYVAPIATAASSSHAPFNLLGYGTDNQVVQSSALTVLQNGNMGIGTNVPGSLLNLFGTMPRLQIIDVTSSRQPSIEFLRGQTLFDGNPSYSNWRIVASGGQTDGVMPAIAGGTLGFYHNGGGLVGYTMVLSDGGNVGIGTANPVGSLHINGITGAGLWGNSCLVITNGIPGASGTPSGTSIQLHNAFNTNYFNIMAYGYTGGSAVYITSDSLVGVTFARGQNAWSTYSDSRMKINKVPLSEELSNILKLNPVSYLYDSDPTENVNIVSRVGFLADEVFDIYPNLVTKDSGMPHTNQDGETFIPMTMCMTNLIPYHTKAIQELAYKNDALEAKNVELTQKLDTLSASHATLLAWAQTQGFS